MNPFLTVEKEVDSEWASRANCKGKAFELFEYQEKDSPLTKDMKFKERLAFNYQNFQLAGEICIECPVMFECLNSASEQDRYWTVRGGEPPKRFAMESEQLARLEQSGGGKPKPGTPRTCQRGHYLPTGGRCRTCKREQNTIRQREVRRRAREAAANGVS